MSRPDVTLCLAVYVAGIIPAGRIPKLIDLCRNVGSLADAGEIARAAAT